MEAGPYATIVLSQLKFNPCSHLRRGLENYCPLTYHMPTSSCLPRTEASPSFLAVPCHLLVGQLAMRVVYIQTGKEASLGTRLGYTVKLLIVDPPRYNRPLYKGQFSRSQIIRFPIVLIHFEEEDNLSTKDTTAESILSPKCLLFRGFTVYTAWEQG